MLSLVNNWSIDLSTHLVNVILFGSWYLLTAIHYVKLCPWQLDHPITRAPKQLIYNCIATIPWKYDKFINKMPCHKINKLY